MELESRERLRAVLKTFESRGRDAVKEPQLSPDEIRFRSLLIVMEKECLSFRQATKLVGGIRKLNKLLESGKIRGLKPDGSRNKMWKINAADCYKNIKPRLSKVS